MRFLTYPQIGCVVFAIFASQTDTKSHNIYAMPANKNALIRYKTIDRCLSNHYRRWTLEDLVDACCMALNEMEGLSKGVSVRTVQATSR